MTARFLLGATALVTTMGLTAGFSSAQEVQVAAADPAPEEEIVVLGRGQSRQVQTIRGEEMQRLVPGASPIKLVDKLPGVSYTAADPFGAYEWAVRINIRGFNQNQLGFVLDDVPLGDMSYGNNNGLHISRALISENIDRVELAQGSGSLDVASSGNLGGTLKFLGRDPSDTAGVVAAVTGGSDSTLRGYIRLETGELTTNGLKASASYVNSRADKWKGDGEQNQEQYNFRAVLPVGDAKITAWVNKSERRENDYQDLSLQMIDRLGYDWDNISGDYALAVLIADIANNRGDTGAAVTNPGAGTVYPGPIQTVDDAYFDAAGIRDDLLSAVQIDWPVNDVFSVKATVYSHQNEGQGLWGTPYLGSPLATVPGAGTLDSPITIRTTEYDLNRTGFVGSVTFDIGDHSINGGVWYEQNDFTQFRRFYALNRSNPGRSFQEFQNNPFFSQWGYGFETETWKFHIQDTWKVTDALTVNFGFKSLSVENSVETLVRNNAAPVPGAATTLNGTIKTEDHFLPQIGVVYEIDDDNQVFASFAENVAAYTSAATAGPFASQNQLVVDEVSRTLEPESSQTYELGFRTRGDRFQASAAAYYVAFDNRLLAVTQGAGIVGNAPILSNVGSVETIGLELAGTYEITDAISAFASYTFNQSEYQDDIVNAEGTTLAFTGGKRVVNTPEHLFKAQLNYDDEVIFGGVGVSYTGERYYTYENIGGLVDGFTTVDLNVGYRLEVGTGNKVELQLNVTNLLDEEFVSTIGTNGFTNRDPNGAFQTLMVGAPLQAFFSVRAEF